jgi:hypothetical protein
MAARVVWGEFYDPNNHYLLLGIAVLNPTRHELEKQIQSDELRLMVRVTPVTDPPQWQLAA